MHELVSRFRRTANLRKVSAGVSAVCIAACISVVSVLATERSGSPQPAEPAALAGAAGSTQAPTSANPSALPAVASGVLGALATGRLDVALPTAVPQSVAVSQASALSIATEAEVGADPVPLGATLASVTTPTPGSGSSLAWIVSFDTTANPIGCGSRGVTPQLVVGVVSSGFAGGRWPVAGGGAATAGGCVSSGVLPLVPVRAGKRSPAWRRGL